MTQSPAGEATAHGQLDPHDGELLDTLDAVAAGNTDADFLVGLGDYLFGELFVGEIATLYRSSLNMARAQERRLRVQLRIEPPELSALPWEYLYDAAEDAFLATSPETALVRFVSLRLPVRPSQITLPLRVLMVISQPHDLPPLDVAHEKEILEEALAERIAQGKLALQIEEHASVANISQALRSFQPHVFHFVGHGEFWDDRATIVLEDADENAHFVDERAFRELFAGCKETRLAVLNACQTATTSSSQPLAGLAPRLLQRRLSAVVAMQYPVSDQNALIFAREFYRSLAQGSGVDAAVAEARKGIFMEDSERPEWGAPVLFLRAKDGHLFAVAEPDVVTTLQVPPPPEPQQPPANTGFVGRETELRYFTERLKQLHIAVVSGMAGVGKTALAARLAEIWQGWQTSEANLSSSPSHISLPDHVAQGQAAGKDKVFWYSLHEDEGIISVIWQLAGFLAWHGQEDVWRMLQSAQHNGGKPPPANALLGYMLKNLEGQGFLLCLDDVHHIHVDPLLTQFVDRLQPLIAAGEVSMILTSREVPTYILTATFAPLTGLKAADVVQLVAARELSLPDTQIMALYTQTEGNAELLMLAIDILKQAQDPARTLSRLTEAEDIERYLLREVDDALSEDDREVMIAVAILLGYPGTRDAIECVSNRRRLKRLLLALSNRLLLTRQEQDLEEVYSSHAIVRAFYYDIPDSLERQTLHRLAGEYYEESEPDPLRAASHYHQAKEYDLAAKIATAEFWGLINRGQVHALQSLLSEFAAWQVSKEHWVIIKVTEGQIYRFLGEDQAARTSNESALNLLEMLADQPFYAICKARLCLEMAYLFEGESIPQALDWVAQGLNVLGGQDSRLAADLYWRMGSLSVDAGDYAAALAAIQSGKQQLSQPGPWHIDASLIMGIAYFHQGDIAQANAEWQQGLTLSQQLYDKFKETHLLNNLAAAHMVLGDWPAARQAYQEGLDLAESQGDITRLALLILNLGILYTWQGQDEAAEAQFSRLLSLARESKFGKTEINGKYSLADLYLRQGKYSEAATHLTEAEEMVKAFENTSQLPEIYFLWAQVKLAQGDQEVALEYANQALRLAGELGMDREAGISQRVLGQVLADQASSAAAFAHSLELLTNIDPYEAARTQLAWGRYLALSNQRTEAISQLQAARNQFERLGATRDLAIVLDLLASLD
ncbi:MAG: CHAT domain-containing protein [Gammaproteobacteria bacterium]|nr:CHAT domain-containing protein [Gammaproteobacteria bacterium]